MPTPGKLVPLSLDHKHALEVFLCEFDGCRDELHGYFCDRGASIDAAVQLLSDWGRGQSLGDGWVPCSTWFWESEGVLQGVINVRHRLTPRLEEMGGHIGYSVAPSHRRKGVATAMLREVLAHCRALAIRRALLTCNAANEASARTIESNGGVLDREGWCELEQREQRWYWIALEQD